MSRRSKSKPSLSNLARFLSTKVSACCESTRIMPCSADNRSLRSRMPSISFI